MQLSRSEMGPWFERLRRLSGVISDGSKVDIILVALGKKPGALVEISYWRKIMPPSEFDIRLQELKLILRNLKLRTKLYVNYPRNKNDLTKFSCVAASVGGIRGLEAALKIKEASARRKAVGKLLGYPRTAVAAFASGKVLELDKLPKTITVDPDAAFLNIRLSRAHWRQEFRWIKEKRAAPIREFSPLLYRRMVRRRKFAPAAGPELPE